MTRLLIPFLSRAGCYACIASSAFAFSRTVEITPEIPGFIHVWHRTAGDVMRIVILASPSGQIKDIPPLVTLSVNEKSSTALMVELGPSLLEKDQLFVVALGSSDPEQHAAIRRLFDAPESKVYHVVVGKVPLHNIIVKWSDPHVPISPKEYWCNLGKFVDASRKPRSK